jgi:hypothetical protein
MLNSVQSLGLIPKNEKDTRNISPYRGLCMFLRKLPLMIWILKPSLESSN